MKFAYDKYILPDWVLTMDDYRRYAPAAGEHEPSAESEPLPMGRLEIEHRMAQIAANKSAKGYIEHEYDSNELRYSHAVNRCRGNGSRHKSSSIYKNY